MNRLTLDSDVALLSGVGKIKKNQLNRLGIFTIKDLLFYFPRIYENRGDIRSISAADLDIPCSFVLTVASETKSVAIKRGLTVSKFRAFDDSASVEVVFFNSPFVKDIFHTGSTFRFFGKLAASKNRIQLINPKYEPFISGIPLPDFVPIYPLTEGITSKFIDKLICGTIEDVLPYVDDPLDENIRLKNSLCSLSYAIKNIHIPKSKDDLTAAIRRLAFDEMLYFGLGIAKLSQRKKSSEGIKFSPCDITPLLKDLPYQLTNSQKNAVNDIYKDVVFTDSDGKISPMARILVGDVGCGKTICSVIAIYIAVKSGFQASLMAPTEILARQHFADLTTLLSRLNVRVGLLVGSLKPKEKEKLYAEITNGEIDVVVGTHALISDKVDFKKLGLIITDEQHRFGINQRAVLKEKNSSAHMLVMSATPIPRTLALTFYNDLDISRITEMPKVRIRVETFVVDGSYRKRLNAFIESQVKNGGQCYVVCPAIEPSDEIYERFSASDDSIRFYDSSKPVKNIKNVLEYTEKLRQSLPNLNISFLHGKMKTTEKDEIMAAFLEKKIDVLISTTVIEVGVNVPNASLMIIENAERFGLAQLHQLRGRVGRGTRKSYCVLVEGSRSEKSTSRLNVMKTTYDGFEIAEKDLMERGPGDFFASLSESDSLRQSGGLSFKMASLSTDPALMELAFLTAKSIITEDPELTQQKNVLLKKEVDSFLKADFSTIS